MTISIKRLETFLELIPYLKVGKKAGNSTRGQRLFPASTKDKDMNFRLDKGAKISEKEHELIIQANKNAKDPGVRKAAQRNSHDIIAKCVINPKKVDIQKAKSDLLKSFKARMGW
jgi:hypothetical protein